MEFWQERKKKQKVRKPRQEEEGSVPPIGEALLMLGFDKDWLIKV